MTNENGRVRPLCCALMLVGLFANVPAVRSQEQPAPERAGLLRLLPETVETRHTISLPAGPLEYRTEAGTLPLRDGKAEVTAELFFVSHTREPRDARRPVTFVFNGGPGAASAFLHLGAIGPRILAFASNGALLPPPARLADNPDTWLEFTDLVFVDPVGTGYSRTPDPEKASDFWGIDQDASSVAAFIRLFLARHERTGSPVFLAGESYGGFRAAVLSHELQSESGIAPSGVVMISPALEFALTGGSDNYQPLPWALGLPSFAAVELEASGVRGTAALASRLAGVERFALADYLLDLADGRDASNETVEAVARYIGLPLDRVREQGARISPSFFIKAFAMDDHRVLSRYDGSVSGPDPEPENPRPNAPDAVLDRAVPAWTTGFVGYVREELGFRSDITFRLLNGEIAGRWDYGTTPQRQGFAGALDDLQQARALNPAMGVLIAHGYTDLVTPYFISTYLVGQLPPLAGAQPIGLRNYEGGHMMYTRPASRQTLSRDVRALYERAAAAARASEGQSPP